MADTSSFKVLEAMITDDEQMPGISKKFFNQTKLNYSMAADVKKIDIGGGQIHGHAVDFTNDSSNKIILSHTKKQLDVKEKQIGSRASFGIVDILISTNSNQTIRYAIKHLRNYFQSSALKHIDDLLNCPINLLNAGTIIAKKGGSTDYLYLNLTGNVEIISSDDDILETLTAGAFIGEMAALLNEPRKKTYIASSFVWALKIPRNMYQKFIEENDLLEMLLNSRSKRSI